MITKPKSREILCIEDLDKDTNVIEYSIREFFLEEPLSKALKLKYTPVAGQRIFIYPDSNIPRFKLKAFCEKYKVSVAKAKETANVFFMHPESANKDKEYFDYEYRPVFMYKDYFLDYLKKATRVGDMRYIKLINDLANHPDSAVIINDRWTFEQHGVGKYKLNIVEPGDTDDNDNLLVPNCEEVNNNKIYYMNAEQSKNFSLIEGKDVYHSDALLTLLNDNGTVLDEEMYNGLNNLFDSNDVNDHKVAMEAMANCDYQKSAVYLLMIFYHNHLDIFNCDTKNHVNFKSFLKFFDLKPARSIDIDDIIDRLKAKKLLTSANLKIVMEKARELMLEKMTGVTTNFVPTGIAPTETIQKEVEETDALQAPAASIPDNMPEPQITDL